MCVCCLLQYAAALWASIAAVRLGLADSCHEAQPCCMTCRAARTSVRRLYPPVISHQSSMLYVARVCNSSSDDASGMGCCNPCAALSLEVIWDVVGPCHAGNPFVTPDTTRDVVITARLSAVNVFFDAIEKLMFELSIWRCTPEMQARQRLQLSLVCCMFVFLHNSPLEGGEFRPRLRAYGTQCSCQHLP